MRKLAHIHNEILQVADAVAREKMIDRDKIIESIEMAIQKAGRNKYGHDHDIRAHIDRRTGEITLTRHRKVVDVIENDATEIDLKSARKRNPAVTVGEEITDELPPIDLGRVSAQTAKQVIVQKVREAEREKQFIEFKERLGELVNGIVKRMEFNNVIVDIGRTEAVIRRDELIPNENFKNGDRVRAFIYDVRSETHGPQIFLSRTHPGFLKALFGQEVPEVYDGVIEIKAIARDPGSRAKIGVFTHDRNIDPVGTCVGVKGSRVQAVINELQGEKIDIIPWSADPATFVVNALTPAEVSKVVLDEEKHRIDVVVPDEQLSIAIGRRGQNVRLASMLTGWTIDLMTEQEESTKRQEEMKIRSELFTKALNVDDVIAQLLVVEGFTCVEEIAEISISELGGIEGFDEEIAQELQRRAKTWLEDEQKRIDDELSTLKVADDLRHFDNLTPELLIVLGKNKIRTLQDLADLAGDELLEILEGQPINQDQANKLIMDARAICYPETVDNVENQDIPKEQE